MARLLRQGIQLGLEDGLILLQRIHTFLQHHYHSVGPSCGCPRLLLEILRLASPFVDPLMDFLDSLINIIVALQVRLHKFINELAKVMNLALKAIALERGLIIRH